MYECILVLQAALCLTRVGIFHHHEVLVLGAIGVTQNRGAPPRDFGRCPLGGAGRLEGRLAGAPQGTVPPAPRGLRGRPLRQWLSSASSFGCLRPGLNPPLATLARRVGGFSALSGINITLILNYQLV